MTPKEGVIAFMGDALFIKTKPAKIHGDARYGIIVSKRNFRLAIQRNRAKRLLRDWISVNEDLMLPELDYIFIANDYILTTPRGEGRQLIKTGLIKIAKKYYER